MNEQYGILTANQVCSGELPSGTKLYLIDGETDSLIPVLSVIRNSKMVTAKVKPAKSRAKNVILTKDSWIIISYQDLTGKNWSEIKDQTRGVTSLSGLRKKTCKANTKTSCLSHLYVG